ncbi:GTPase-activating protein GCS1 [Aspergillus lucknowensis]|uniref:ArfGap-domain-containing protein n=1 Tax=Aspergillus lucknowensis TaxID=176173 RepID=A0ABR4LMK9_9EURO
MSRMWEVDPETKAKLLQYSRVNGNDRCCDCGAPSPQWASPKFGTFICLNCAGTHRGLGVHISFVRSITMDAFKNSETQRMELGGNDRWKEFFDAHAITQSEGRTFEDSTIKERYEGEVGEEYKDRLSAKAEGREYVPGQRPPQPTKKTATDVVSSRSSTPLSSSGRGSGLSSSAALPDGNGGVEGPGGGRKARNEAYFAKLGSENASRSESLRPSEGGKFTGFGGGLPVSSTPKPQTGNGAIPGFDDFQKDPMAALTKGFGWFATTVGKSAKTVNDSYIQPTAKSLAESEFAAQARQHATQFGQNIQVGARGAADSFQRFVEGPDDTRRGRAGPGTGVEPERKDFWDDFSSLAAQDSHRRTASKSGALGTAAMKPSPAPSGTTSTAPGSGTSATAAGTGVRGASPAPQGSRKSQEEGGWDDNW